MGRELSHADVFAGRSQTRASFSPNRKSQIANRKSQEGFTLVELVVVMGIAAVVAATVVSMMGRMGAGNRNAQCQVQLKTLGQALRMYRLDEEGYPPFDPTAAGGSAARGLGLWALHTYGYNSATGINNIGAPETRYLKEVRAFHCPEDRRSDAQSWKNPTVATNYNVTYNSYGLSDAQSGVSTVPRDRWTYSPGRTTDSTDGDYLRQLARWDSANSLWIYSGVNPPDDTVVTWCTFHRGTLRPRNRDDVLFLDGSVQLLDMPTTTSAGAGWRRSRSTTP